VAFKPGLLSANRASGWSKAAGKPPPRPAFPPPSTNSLLSLLALLPLFALQPDEARYQRPAGARGVLPKEVIIYQYDVCPFCCKVKAFLDYHKVGHCLLFDPELWVVSEL
jgi:hypothetical protein